MTEIFEYVRAALKRSGYYNYLNAGAIITGGGSLINGNQALAQEVLGLDVRIGQPEGITGGMVGELHSPIYATAVGLVLRAIKDLEQQEQFTASMQQAPPKEETPLNEPVTEGEPEKENRLNLFGKLRNWFDQI